VAIDDDGRVAVWGPNEESTEKCKAVVEALVEEAEVGKVYEGKVVAIKEFGCFVEVLPGQEGLVHISELADFRVRRTEDVCKMGDEMVVKCIGIDERGRVRLSRRAALEELEAQNNEEDPNEEVPDETSSTDEPESVDNQPVEEETPKTGA